MTRQQMKLNERHLIKNLGTLFRDNPLMRRADPDGKPMIDPKTNKPFPPVSLDSLQPRTGDLLLPRRDRRRRLLAKARMSVLVRHEVQKTS